MIKELINKFQNFFQDSGLNPYRSQADQLIYDMTDQNDPEQKKAYCHEEYLNAKVSHLGDEALIRRYNETLKLCGAESENLVKYENELAYRGLDAEFSEIIYEMVRKSSLECRLRYYFSI